MGSVRTAIATIPLLLAALTAPARVEASPADEVRAAFLYNFGKFVVWPRAAFGRSSLFTIGVLGDDPIFEALLRTVRDKPLGDRRIEVRRFAQAREARGAQILYVGAGRDDLAAVLDALEGASVLTVSEIEGFAGRGGMIGLVLDGTRYRFEVNLGAVERAGLKMSSQLLKLARRVIAPRTRSL